MRQLKGQELVTGGCKDELRCSLNELVARELHQVCTQKNATSSTQALR